MNLRGPIRLRGSAARGITSGESHAGDGLDLRHLVQLVLAGGCLDRSSMAALDAKVGA
jgi:hypothetical protein